VTITSRWSGSSVSKAAEALGFFVDDGVREADRTRRDPRCARVVGTAVPRRAAVGVQKSTRSRILPAIPLPP
jgi:hypothetical protein